MILELLDQAVKAGARCALACETLGIDVRTVQRWRKADVGEDGRNGPRTRTSNALSAKERQKILDTCNSEEYCDMSPKQIVPLLADAGTYLASESSIYRILRAEGQQKHRAPWCEPVRRYRPAPLTATAPNQVWTADVTYLPAQVHGHFYKLCLALDIWSRKIVGYAVHETESAELTAAMVEAACLDEGVLANQLTLHTDNGSAMKGSTVLAKLQELGVASSLSRPSVSNDNPYPEALFRTAKYAAEHPCRRFESLKDARRWADAFVDWYNNQHLHSAIRFVTPAQRHRGEDVAILANRAKVYAAARKARPERWANKTRAWDPIQTVTLNPAPEQANERAA